MILDINSLSARRGFGFQHFENRPKRPHPLSSALAAKTLYGSRKQIPRWNPERNIIPISNLYPATQDILGIKQPEQKSWIALSQVIKPLAYGLCTLAGAYLIYRAFKDTPSRPPVIPGPICGLNEQLWKQLEQLKNVSQPICLPQSAGIHPLQELINTSAENPICFASPIQDPHNLTMLFFGSLIAATYSVFPALPQLCKAYFPPIFHFPGMASTITQPLLLSAEPFGPHLPVQSSFDAKNIFKKTEKQPVLPDFLMKLSTQNNPKSHRIALRIGLPSTYIPIPFQPAKSEPNSTQRPHPSTAKPNPTATTTNTNTNILPIDAEGNLIIGDQDTLIIQEDEHVITDRLVVKGNLAIKGRLTIGGKKPGANTIDASKNTVSTPAHPQIKPKPTPVPALYQKLSRQK